MTRHIPMTAYRTIIPTTVMPPRTQAPQRIPVISMDDDARICNARLRTHMGSSNTAGQEQSRKARIIREAKEANVLAAITEAPGTVADIMATTGLADSAVRSAIETLRHRRLVVGGKVGQAYVYRVVDPIA